MKCREIKHDTSPLYFRFTSFSPSHVARAWNHIAEAPSRHARPRNMRGRDLFALNFPLLLHFSPSHVARARFICIKFPFHFHFRPRMLRGRGIISPNRRSGMRALATCEGEILGEAHAMLLFSPRLQRGLHERVRIPGGACQMM